MQSGCDEILTSMKRKYDVAFYKEIINKILLRFPNAAIGADMIVGYPGETEEQFKETYNLAKELPITHFHVFPYSKRKGTIAARSEYHIHQSVKKERSRALHMFGEAKLAMLSEDMVGTSTEVLFERRNKEGFFGGYSTNFVKVFVKTDSELKNEIRRVHLTSFRDGKLYGELIQ